LRQVSLIIVNSKIPAKNSSTFAHSLLNLLHSKGVREIIILAALSFTPQQGHSNSVHQCSFFYKESKYNYPMLTSSTLIVDPLVASLLHFVKMSEIPTTFLFIRGIKASFTKRDGSDEAVLMLIKVLTSDFGFTYSAKFLSTLLPNKITFEDLVVENLYI